MAWGHSGGLLPPPCDSWERLALLLPGCSLPGCEVHWTWAWLRNTLTWFLGAFFPCSSSLLSRTLPCIVHSPPLPWTPSFQLRKPIELCFSSSSLDLSCLEMAGRNPERLWAPHLSPSPSLRGHSPVLPMKRLLRYSPPPTPAPQFSSCSWPEVKSRPCYSSMARSESKVSQL